MRARFSGFLIAAAVLLPAAAQAAERRPIVAVFDVEAKGIKLSRSLLERLSEYLSSRLAETGRYMVIPRDDLKKRLLGQKSKSYKQCYDRSCQIEMGREMAADKTIATQVIKLGSRCMLTSTLYDLKKAATEIAATVQGKCGEDEIVNSLNKVVDKLSEKKDGIAQGDVGVSGKQEEKKVDKLSAQSQGGKARYLEMIESYKKGNKAEAYAVGVFFFSGLGGAPHSYKKANKWFSKAAANGNALAMVKLGDASVYGYGTAVNKPKALKWYKKAAIQGDVEGQNKLGDMYCNGEGTKQDHVMAAKWYQKAAEGGSSEACSKLGWLYRSGYGVKADNAAALKWYSKAFDLGDNTAAVFIANIYWGGGKGIKRDLGKSSEWLLKGAVGGDPSAMLKLAKAYVAGEGIRRDYAEAYKWLTVVTEKGNDPLAERLLQSVERKMSAAELAKARKQASELAAKYVTQKDRDNKKYEKTHKGL